MANFFWSLNFIIGKLVGTVMPPATVSFFRWGVPLLFFLSFCWRDIKANLALYRRHWLLLTVLGCAVLTLGMGWVGTALALRVRPAPLLRNE